MAALVIPDEKLLILPHETYFRVDHPWPVLPSRADGAHMPELFCFSFWCEKIWTCACWLQWSRFGCRGTMVVTSWLRRLVWVDKNSRRCLFLFRAEVFLSIVAKKWKVVFVLSECHAETSWTAIVARWLSECRLIKRSWVRIQSGFFLFLSFVVDYP